MRWLAGVMTAAALVMAALFWTGHIVLPPDYDPWAPLDVRAEPNILTGFKLSRLEGDMARCLAVLDGSGLRFTPRPDRPSDVGCALEDTIQVSRSTGLEFSSGFTATCALGAAWALFERNALQPAAQRHLGQPVVRVIHLGTYACRNVYGRPEGRRSEHATANAIDVAAFLLADGSRVSVSGDWNGTSSARRAFLRDVRDGACRFFDVVLGPAYNEAHRDHFHLDMGRFRTCR